RPRAPLSLRARPRPGGGQRDPGSAARDKRADSAGRGGGRLCPCGNARRGAGADARADRRAPAWTVAAYAQHPRGAERAVIELGVNVDHVATVRQARRTYEPDPVWAAVEAHLGGADGITCHLRE